MSVLGEKVVKNSKCWF